MTRVDRYINGYLSQFSRPVAEVDASFARWVIFGYFLYKLLSRDFSSFGLIPPFLLEVYPIDVYGLNYYALMGTKLFTDLATFHFIHWALPLPGEQILKFIQWVAVIACAAACLFGRGPYRVFVIASYVLIMYLWGFMFRSGSDIDAVFLGMSAALFYCFSNHREALTLLRPVGSRERTAEAGWTYSAMIMVFVIYYFASGVNKLIDISILDWFRFDLVQSIEVYQNAQRLGYYAQSPVFFERISNQYWLNYLGVPLVYLSHLLIPTMFYDRKLIPAFWLFYIIFHGISWGVGILFFGNFILWLAFLPVHRLCERMVVQWRPHERLGRSPIKLLRMLDTFKLIHFIEEKGLEAPLNIRARAEESGEVREGFAAYRRILWAVPLLWPLLPFLYIFGALHVLFLFLPRFNRADART